MKNYLLTLLVIGLTAPAFAGNSDVSVNCNIATIRGAQACMNRLANKMQDYEEPNEGMVSINKDKAAKLMKALYANRAVSKVMQADFIGAVLEHGDEHQVYYYAMKKGRNVRPELLTYQNLVDLAGSDPILLELEPLDVLLGVPEMINSDVYGDIEMSFHELQEESQE